jgi:hypothetical protein
LLRKSKGDSNGADLFLEQLVEHFLESTSLSRNGTAITFLASESSSTHAGFDGRRVHSVSRARFVLALGTIVALVANTSAFLGLIAYAMLPAVYQSHFSGSVVAIRDGDRAKRTSPSSVTNTAIDRSVTSTIVTAKLFAVIRGFAAFVSSSADSAVVVEHTAETNAGTVLVGIVAKADIAVILVRVVSSAYTAIVLCCIGFNTGVSSGTITTTVRLGGAKSISVAINASRTIAIAYAANVVDSWTSNGPVTIDTLPKFCIACQVHAKVDAINVGLTFVGDGACAVIGRVLRGNDGFIFH